MFLRVKCQWSNVSCRQKGFSLIELVVVLAVFFIILAVTIDIFISVVQNQKRLSEEQELLNQASYATEYMSKALRLAVKDPDGTCLGTTGYVYVLTHCPNGTLQACQGIKFINGSDNNACQEFFLDESVSATNPPLRGIKNGGAAQNILSSKFNIKYGRFILDGDRTVHSATSSDAVQPKVTMLLDILTASNQSEKVIQKTVSQMSVK